MTKPKVFATKEAAMSSKDELLQLCRLAEKITSATSPK